MKYLLMFLPLVGISMAQRPTYAGSSAKGYPELASRFRDPADDQDQNVAVGNRLGEEDQRIPQNLPTDARGDAALVNRVKQWPKENWPFWLLNTEQLEKHRHPDGTTRSNQQNNQVQQGQRGSAQDRQGTFTGNQQVSGGADGGQTGQVQSRFGEPVGTETRTIKPLSQRGSFVGSRS